jgi:hypothetical protein
VTRALCAAIAVASCRPAGDDAAASKTEGGVDLCGACSEPAPQGRLESAAIDEASGIAPSARGPHLYVNNDSGDAARFFAVDLAGHDLGSYLVAGARAIDWEDIAVGPCPEGSCVFLGDIGDNRARRPSYVVYRVPEPASVEPGAHEIAGVALPFRYPDGSHDAETLVVDGAGDIHVVTKGGGGATVYRFPRPHVPGASATLEKLGAAATPSGSSLVTSGALAGGRLLLRTYSSVWLYEVGPGGLGALGQPACALPAPPEAQGEAIAWYGDASYLTVGEGRSSAIYRVTCKTGP